MKILIIGRMGQVAWELQRELACLGEIIVADRHTTPYAIDLLNDQSINTTISAISPKLIINAAAHTAVDQAETEIASAMQINGNAVGVLANAAKKCGAVLIHYSTDYVFNGIGCEPYNEDHPTAPQSIYGHSKLLGEQAILDSGVEHLILRTAWVYGGRGKNFLLTMLRLMQERSSLSIVADQFGSPTWSRHIAIATGQIVAQTRRGDAISLDDKSGIYHLTSANYTTWFGFAEQIYTLAQQAGFIANSVQLNPISTADYPTPAQRPAYSVLSGKKLQTQFDLALPDWHQGLEHCFADYLASK